MLPPPIRQNMNNQVKVLRLQKKIRSHPGNDSESRISVKLAGDPNVSVTQCATCGMDAEPGINPRTKLLAQRVQRLVRIDPLFSQPTRP